MMIRLLLSVCLLALQTPTVFAQQFRIKKLVKHTHYNKPAMTEAYTFDYHYSGDKPGSVNWRWAEGISSLNNALLWNGATMLYDSATQTHNNPVSPPASAHFFQSINPLNLVTQREIYERSSASAPLALAAQQTYTYDNTTLLASTFNSDAYDYRYKNGKLDTMYYHYAGMPQPTSTYVYSYNPGGQLTEMAIYSSSGLIVTSYYYNAQNLITDRITITTNYATSVTDTTYRTIYTYNGQNPAETEEIWAGTLGADLQQKALHLNKYDAGNNKLEMLTRIERNGLAGLDTLGKRIYTYNSYGQIIKLEFLNWDGTQFIQKSDTSEATSSHTLTMDYELYWPVNVAEVEDAANVKLYPSPASDFIRIETGWKNAQPFTAAILDMQGRIVRQWDEPATKHYARSIPLTELPAGMYVLKLSCGEEQLSKQFAVYK